MPRPAILSVALAAFALSLAGCGDGSSAAPLSQEEKDKKAAQMKEQMMQGMKSGKPGSQ